MNFRGEILAVYKRCAQLFSGRGLRKISFIDRLHEFILSLLKSTIATVHGHILFLDPNDALRLSIEGVHEPLATQLVLEALRPGNVAVDVGANIGYYTLILARQVGREGMVIAFEPDPHNFFLLKKNVAANQYDNVRVLNQLVSDQNKKIPFYLSKDPTMNRLYSFPDVESTLEIEAVSLDDFPQLPERIDFLKIDVVGAEWKVIRGASKLIERNPGLQILTGFSPERCRKSGFSPEAYLKLLQKFKFIINWINEPERKVQAIDIPLFMNHFQNYPEEDVNLWCTRTPLL